jgi:hypothetical protein
MRKYNNMFPDMGELPIDRIQRARGELIYKNRAPNEAYRWLETLSLLKDRVSNISSLQMIL